MSQNSNTKFSRAFWTANAVELFERSAYYGVFIAVTLYLTDVVHFTDVESAWIAGVFAAGLYFFPPFTGAYADKLGFRTALILAFSLLSTGYFVLGFLPYKPVVLPAIFLLMIGGSFIKSIITGTVAKSSNPENRARAYSIFYGMVNLGAFLGKTIAYPLRIELGLVYINFFSSLMTFIALVTVFLLYKNIDDKRDGKSIKEIWDSFVRVITNPRLMSLILIVAGFWIIQQQMYATMPKYVLRTVGKYASPEWISNVNPAIVVVFVVIITNFMKKVSALRSMSFGMFLMPLSAFSMASSFILEHYLGTNISVFGLFHAHPITIMLIVGITIQGLAECFISPRYLEFFSLRAPKGSEGLYLGFAHLHSFFAAILGFGISGYLLQAYCPDPKTLTEAQKLTAYDHAYYIWFYFAGIGLLAAIALLIYARITEKEAKANSMAEQA